MKTKFYIFSTAVLITVTTFAQAPEKMSYQAVVRDSGDAIVANQTVGMQISILQTTSTGTAVYVETQTPNTNINGLVTLEIGTGTIVSGDFSTIDWSADSYFIKTETDPTGGSSYTITGTSQLLSVPYALHVKTVTQPTYTVNSFYAELGGYVIEINSDGTHGLVAAMQDQGQTRGYNADDLLSNSANHDINGAKFKDWRLPTIRELNLIYINRVSIGGFITATYWSSYITENSQVVQNFSSGDTYFLSRSETTGLRAVRAF